LGGKFFVNIHRITSVDFAGIFGNYSCGGDLRCSRMYLPHPHGQTAPSGPGPSHSRSHSHNLR